MKKQKLKKVQLGKQIIWKPHYVSTLLVVISNWHQLNWYLLVRGAVNYID